MNSKLRALTRAFCTTQSSLPAHPVRNFDSLHVSIRKRARVVSDAIAQARQAVDIATQEGSEHDEREEALKKARYAIFKYDQLLTNGSPPIHPVSKGERSEQHDALNKSQPVENDVSQLLGQDVKQLKEELYMANRQRVWMGWHNWF